MTTPDTVRAQMRSRKDREWRDATNPYGPPSAGERGEPRPDGGRPPELPEMRERVETDSTAGPGGGGDTEWPGRGERYQGQHGGPSRKP
jgi:hypothetical protein